MIVALANSKLCMNCEYISDAADAKTETCLKCGEHANWLPLGKILSGKGEVSYGNADGRGYESMGTALLAS